MKNKMQRLPVDISTFSELRHLNCVYVDKTEYMYQMITTGRRYFLSRPRRFGKSLLVSTLGEILAGNKQLFEGLWISSSDYDWSEHAVINLDFSRLHAHSLEIFKQQLRDELLRIANNYSITIETTNEPSFVLENVVFALFEKYGRIAILVDEYDSQILKTLHDVTLAKSIRNEIQHFFAVIKSLDAQIQFVFITGVTSFAKAGLFSGVNNLQIMTLDKKYASICGYTDSEVDHYFHEHITDWAHNLSMPYDTLRNQIKEWYNGYSFGYNVDKVYNPFSLMNALRTQEFENFWFQSGTPTFLVEILKKEYKSFDFEHLVATKDFLGIFDVDTIPLLSLMFQAGYLTITDYDSDSHLFSLDYPNAEVRIAFQKYLLAVFTHTDAVTTQQLMAKLFVDLNNQKIEDVIEHIQQLFAHIPYQLYMKQEKFYHSLFIMICLGANIKHHAEYSTNLGRIDLVMELPKVIYVTEIKFNDTAKNALAQIEERRYYERFLSQNKPVILFGLVFKKGPEVFDIEYAIKKL